MGDSKSTTDEDKMAVPGIPEERFVEDIDSFMSLEENSGGAEMVLKKLDDQHSKYKFMEINLITKRRRLMVQIPDLENSLKLITLFKKKQDSLDDIDAQFLLSEQVYMRAIIPSPEKVSLWLGANVMLEYTMDDAATLLRKSIATAKSNVLSINSTLDYLRDQSTTTEVIMARVYNWNVKRRQAAKEAA